MSKKDKLGRTKSNALQNFNSKLRLTLFNKIILLLAFMSLLTFGTFRITESYFNNQFKIIYNLDKKQNDQEIIKLIDQADKYVYFAIFTFTKDNIADALIRAKKRGIIVWGITDLKQSITDFESPIVKKLNENGIKLETQKHFDGIMHIKAVVTDKAYAMGSYNWTESATIANDELLEIGTNRYLHDQYLSILERLLKQNE